MTRFGLLLRRLRHRRRLSLSAVARSLGVSVVYYRDVENGTRKPFSATKVDFGALAALLGSDRFELQQVAARERGQLELDFSHIDTERQRLAVLFSNSLPNKRLAKAHLRYLRRYLERLG